MNRQLSSETRDALRVQVAAVVAQQAAVTEQVVTRPERRQAGVARQFGLDPVPAQAGQVDVAAH